MSLSSEVLALLGVFKNREAHPEVFRLRAPNIEAWTPRDLKIVSACWRWAAIELKYAIDGTAPALGDGAVADQLAALERSLLVRAVNEGQTLRGASERLGMPRTTLLDKCRRHKISVASARKWS